MGKWKIISYRKCNINSIKKCRSEAKGEHNHYFDEPINFPNGSKHRSYPKACIKCERYCDQNKKKYLHSRYVYLFNNIFQWCSHFLQNRFVKREFGCRLCWFGNCWCSWRNGFWCARPFFLIILLFFSDLTIWSD